MAKKFIPTQKGIILGVVVAVGIVSIDSMLISAILCLVFYLSMAKFGSFFFMRNPIKSAIDEVLDNDDYKVKNQWGK
jgi:hypothetical protein